MSRPCPQLVGRTFGRLRVLSKITKYDSNGRFRTFWVCACSCGPDRLHLARVDSLLSGQTRSCGCLRLETVRNANRKHGMSFSPEYKSWVAMKERCFRRTAVGYENYGGRGITVCYRWMDFRNFFKDMGPRPRGCTLDRIDVDGNYEPSNCRWATVLEQSNNLRKHLASREMAAQLCKLQSKNEGETAATRAKTEAEVWKPVVGYERLYSVSSLGRVRRDAPRHKRVAERYPSMLIRPHRMWNGYLQACLYGENGDEKRLYIHAMVLEAFVVSRPIGHEAHHRNGNRADNSLSNLEWLPRAKNRAMRGERNNFARLTWKQVKEIRKLWASGATNRSIRMRFRCGEDCVRRIVTGSSWKVVT